MTTKWGPVGVSTELPRKPALFGVVLSCFHEWEQDSEGIGSHAECVSSTLVNRITAAAGNRFVRNPGRGVGTRKEALRDPRWPVAHDAPNTCRCASRRRAIARRPDVDLRATGQAAVRCAAHELDLSTEGQVHGDRQAWADS